MPEFLSPGHYVTEAQPQVVTITGTATSTAALIGIAEKGPIGQATLITSWTQFKETFGGFIANGWLAYAAYGLFMNKQGARVYVVRTAHYTDPSDPETITAIKATITLKDKATTPVDTLQVDAINEGTWGNRLKVKIEDATKDPTNKFKLTVLETVDGQDIVREVFDELSMIDTDPDYVETRINGVSKYITVTDKDSATTAPNDRPAAGTFSLANGSDGLVGLVDADYIGSPAGRTGLYALDVVQESLLIAIPGVATSAVQNAALDYAAGRKDCFVVLDPPFGNTPDQVKTYVETTAGLNSSYGAIYYPNVKIMDPLTSKEKVVPPSGFIIGAYARTDGDKGVWKVAAGIEDGRLVGVIGLETDLVNDKAVRDVLYPARINPICFLRGYGIRVYGARTLDSSREFPYINERRTFIYCEKSIYEGTQFAEFENNESGLWKRLTRSITSFLLTVWKQGGLRGEKPQDAFVVKIDEELNTQEFIDQGIVRGLIGLATQRPAEFIWFEFQRKVQTEG
ncbi:phage tail sheath family protein [Biomaibacter acetigenes]|uniref:Phage tail sheath family protein n=1 Tax=Biomaibacter acetigenes TaxID=2316383 RepID=A0A3G2R5A9_9FIRM|nr:phage tail sheath subtilisin-like domain-containing protein [Biomaibacter acetigenes]AYO30592.1 phage tail sheath family protein [Biomaibacter acetigenes]